MPMVWVSIELPKLAFDNVNETEVVELRVSAFCFGTDGPDVLLGLKAREVTAWM